MLQDQNPSIVKSRWVQLIVGIVGMVAIANLQYGWTLFVGPINQKFGWGAPAIQVAFTLFVLAETWLVPFEAYFVDRYGPRVIVAVGGILGWACLDHQRRCRYTYEVICRRRYWWHWCG